MYVFGYSHAIGSFLTVLLSSESIIQAVNLSIRNTEEESKGQSGPLKSALAKKGEIRHTRNKAKDSFDGIEKIPATAPPYSTSLRNEHGTRSESLR